LKFCQTLLNLLHHFYFYIFVMEDPAPIPPQEEGHMPAESEKAPGGTNSSQFFVQARENTLVKFVLYETKPVLPPDCFARNL
jgi:hypothetical protein